MFNKTNAQKAAQFNKKSASIIAPMRKMMQDLEVQNGDAALFESDIDQQIAELIAQKENVAQTRQANAQFIDKLNNLFGFAPSLDLTDFDGDGDEEDEDVLGTANNSGGREND